MMVVNIVDFFDEYCRRQDIRHQKTPKTPQLNGLIESMNRTLMEDIDGESQMFVF